MGDSKYYYKGVMWRLVMKRIPKWGIGVALGIIFLVVGAFNGQFAEIYRKAVMICLECIGIG